MKRIIEKLEWVRLRRDITQSEVEMRAGLTKGRLTKWANGAGEPTARQALRVADVLGVGLRWLADDDAPRDDWERSAGPSREEGEILYLAAQLGRGRAWKLLVDALAAPPRGGEGDGGGEGGGEGGAVAPPRGPRPERPAPHVEVTQKAPRRTRTRKRPGS